MKNKLNRLLATLLFASLFVMPSCARKDPSVNDLKSPCVTNDSDFMDNSPCVRRKLLENYIV